MRHLILLFAIGSFLLTSCGNIEEEYVINTDGSGTYTVKSDMIPMMIDMTVSMTKAFSKDSTLNEDSLRMAVEEKVWKDFEGSIDSTIDYSDKMPDSLMEKPEVQHIMKNLRGFMQGSKKEQQLFVGATYSFSDNKDLEGFYDFMNKQNQNSENTKDPLSSFKSPNTKTSITLNGKVFTRKTVLIKEGDLPENTEKIVTSMTNEAKYRTTVIMPRKIKTAEGNGLVEFKGKKAVFEYDYMAYMKGKADTDFIITLK